MTPHTLFIPNFCGSRVGHSGSLHLSSSLTHSCLESRCVSSNIVLLTQAFRKKFVIPDFEEFTGHVDRIFEDTKELAGGKVRAGELREWQGLWAGYALLLVGLLGLGIQQMRNRTSKNRDKGFMYFYTYDIWNSEVN